MKKSRRSPPLPACYTVSKEDNTESNEHAATIIPFIDHKGDRFYSDRFYLNASSTSTIDAKISTSLPSVSSSSSSSAAAAAYTKNVPLSTSCQRNETSTAATNICDCGNLQAPPTFPRIEFIKSLDLKAAVMATFNINCEWFYRTLPRFGKTDGGVPTMIFHGSRGLENALRKMVQEADELEYETDRGEDDDDDDGENDFMKGIKTRVLPPSTIDVARHFVDNDNMKFLQVHCNWDKTKLHANNSKLKGGTSYVSSEKEKGKGDDNEEDSKDNKYKNRETRLGVHHPKFMLLFEQSGDLVVIVTTSNLSKTSRSVVEGSWIQRFHPRRSDSDGDSNGNSDGRSTNDNGIKKQETNDFGPVLQDFLFQLSEAAAAGSTASRRKGVSTIPTNNNTLPLEEFLFKHLGMNSLCEFSSSYNFETARAHLVPVVPGDYEYDPNNGDENNRYHYGRQRVRYILDKLATYAPTISKKTKDKSRMDRLVLQPTSLGSNWTNSQLASLIREYMGYYDGGVKKQYYRDDLWVCRQADIVWCTDKFLVDVASNGAKGNKKTIISPLMAATTTARRKRLLPTLNSLMFNSTKNFNLFGSEFISRMAVYEPSTPCQTDRKIYTIKQECRNSENILVAVEENSTPSTETITVKRVCVISEKVVATIEERSTSNIGKITIKQECTSSGKVVAAVKENNNSRINRNKNKDDLTKSPHFKSIARLFQNLAAMHKRNVPPADAYFSWFLMTSACLSRGAQGATVDEDIMAQRRRKYVDESSSQLLSSSSSVVGYRNFELGVLFASHLPRPSKQKQQQRGFVYCFHPHQCSCDKSSSSPSPSPPPELVHLPVPYNIRPESYFEKENDDDDGGVMKYDPFFHEILDDNRCVGNMRLTPFGQNEIQQMLVDGNARNNNNKRRKKTV